MFNFPIKSALHFLQIRALGTKTSKLIQPILKPPPAAAISSEQLKPKTRRKREQVDSSEREECVIALFKKYNFTDTHIAALVKRKPEIFRSNVESTLEPKLIFLTQNGFVGDALTALILANPLILHRSLTRNLIPNYEYLKQIMKADEAASMVVVQKTTRLLTTDLRKILQPNIDYLLEQGVSMNSILKMFTAQPRVLLCSLDRIHYAVATLRKYGIEPTEKMFIHGLRAVLSLTEPNFKKKVEVLKSLGWSDEDITTTIARLPFLLSQSEEKLKRAFDFFVKTMHLKPEEVISQPVLVMYSLGKRSIPRCKVVMALKEKKLLEQFHMPTLLNMNDDKFVRKFILKYPTISSTLQSLYSDTVAV